MPQPMPCPRCGRPMNFHALRERDPQSPEEVSRAERFGGLVVDEFHSCANCHITASRPA